MANPFSVRQEARRAEAEEEKRIAQEAEQSAPAKPSLLQRFALGKTGDVVEGLLEGIAAPVEVAAGLGTGFAELYKSGQ